jgi:hypothetical protein
VEQTIREQQHTQVNNYINLVDFAASYQINARWSASVSMPLLFAKRFNERTPDQVTHGTGIGDTNISARMWIIRPPTESRQNVSIGFGLKLPTGNPGQRDTVVTQAGSRTVVIDQSIQPGDGGVGFTLDAQAYKSTRFATFYGSGVYLFNPKDTNGVLTGRSRPSEAIMSVPDQYLYRFGGMTPAPKFRSVTLSMGIRGEGIPVRDAFGKSNGFRRPGVALSLDPGLIYTRGQDQWSFNTPVAVYRNRKKSVTDIMDGTWGDAAFADYVILVGYTHQF